MKKLIAWYEKIKLENKKAACNREIREVRQKYAFWFGFSDGSWERSLAFQKAENDEVEKVRKKYQL